MLGFFALEKLIHWHHAHDIDPAAAALHADERATAVIVLTGTSMHNLIAGVLLGAAVLTGHNTALLLFAAILAHHIPQQVGDLSVLVMMGMRRGRALALTLASSAAFLAGGFIALVLLSGSPWALSYVLVVAGASLIYIALADLISHLHTHHPSRRVTLTVTLVARGLP